MNGTAAIPESLYWRLYWLGFRRGEALGIRPMDITYVARVGSQVIHIATSVDAKKRVGKTKTASSDRSVAIPSTLKNELDNYINRDKDWAITQSGVPYICIRGMRHSAATNLISSGEVTATDAAGLVIPANRPRYAHTVIFCQPHKQRMQT